MIHIVFRHLALALVALTSMWGCSYCSYGQANYSVSADAYRLDEGDVLAVVVHEVLGDFSSAPIHDGTGGQYQPTFGHPVLLRENGVVDLPIIPQISLRGLTVTQAEEKIGKAYVEKDILVSEHYVTANLLYKRRVAATVIHSPATRRVGRRVEVSGGVQTATRVVLPADEATVLDALAQADARFDAGSLQVLNSPRQRATGLRSPISEGDILEAQTSLAGSYFTGGQVPNGEYSIPAGRPITPVEAVLRAGGQLDRPESFGPSELSVVRNGQVHRFNTNQLLNQGHGFYIHPGDYVLLRNTPADSIGNIGWLLLRRSVFNVFGG